MGRSTLYKITDQRGDVFYIAAPSLAHAAEWFEHHGPGGRDGGGLCQGSYVCAAEGIGQLMGVIEPDSTNANAPVPAEVRER